MSLKNTLFQNGIIKAPFIRNPLTSSFGCQKINNNEFVFENEPFKNRRYNCADDDKARITLRNAGGIKNEFFIGIYN